MRTLSRSLIVALAIVACACTPVSLKQKATITLQSVETALGAAQDFERANHTALGLDTVASDGQRALCPSSALPVPLSATATKHQVVSCLFVLAFSSQIQSSTALTQWQAGQPVPSVMVDLRGEVDAIFGIASGLTSNQNQQAWLATVKTSVDSVLNVMMLMLGGR